jgi:hypothetical protein
MSTLLNRPIGRQRGISLFITLIALMLLALAGAAMVRAIDAGGIVIGNIAFRQGGVQASDIGVEHARAFLDARDDPTSNLYNNIIDVNGVAVDVDGNPEPDGVYFATWGLFDPVTYDWTNGNLAHRMTAAELPAGLVGYNVSWVIHRMCAAVGAPTLAATNCLRVTDTTTGGDSKKAVAYGDYNKSGTVEKPYYRITTRVGGPRGTTTFVQAIVF